MARTCSICSHPERAEIERAIVDKRANRAISRQYRVSKDAVARHAAGHLPGKIVKRAEARELIQTDNLVDQLKDLQAKTLDILRKAEKAANLRVATGAIREARGNLELLARLTGELAGAKLAVGVGLNLGDQRLPLATVDAIIDAARAGELAQ